MELVRRSSHVQNNIANIIFSCLGKIKISLSDQEDVNCHENVF